MRSTFILLLLFVTLFSTATLAQDTTAIASRATPSKELIDQKILDRITKFATDPIVLTSIENQNIKHKSVTQKQIDELDQKWRKETKSDKKPLISAVLSSPLSFYTSQIQARSIGLYSEIFVMDNHGLNVGQSSISSDYWQGDEAKFKKHMAKAISQFLLMMPNTEMMSVSGYPKSIYVYPMKITNPLAPSPLK